MHFSQLFFYHLLLLGSNIAALAFPFLQEIGTDPQQHSTALLATKEKQPILLPAEKGPSAVDVSQKEEFQSAKIEERIETLESAEEAEPQAGDLSEVISQIKEVDSFHEQLELEKAEGRGGGGGGEEQGTMLGQMGTSSGGGDSAPPPAASPSPASSIDAPTTRAPVELFETTLTSVETASEAAKTSATQMATLLLSAADADKEKGAKLEGEMENGGGSLPANGTSATMEYAEEEDWGEKAVEENGTKIRGMDGANSGGGADSEKKFFPGAPEEGAGQVPPPAVQVPVDQFLGGEEEEEREEEEEEDGQMSLWEKIVLGLRCARQDCRDTLIGGEEPQRLIKGWKITRRARRSMGAADGEDGGGQKFVCPCKNAILL